LAALPSRLGTCRVFSLETWEDSQVAFLLLNCLVPWSLMSPERTRRNPSTSRHPSSFSFLSPTWSSNQNSSLETCRLTDQEIGSRTSLRSSSMPSWISPLTSSYPFCQHPFCPCPPSTTSWCPWMTSWRPWKTSWCPWRTSWRPWKISWCPWRTSWTTFSTFWKTSWTSFSTSLPSSACLDST